MIWDHLIKCKDEILSVLDRDCEEYSEAGMEKFNKESWTNRTWKNKKVRRVHFEIVDARDTRGQYMLHLSLFPNLTNSGPIYGWVAIAGKNKVRYFHDYSPLLVKEHSLSKYFIEESIWFKPSKPRKRAAWATEIFSEGVISGGNIKDEKEINQICTLATSNLESYLDKISDFDGDSKKEDVIKGQNFYCESFQNQQQNPHTPSVLQSLGLPEEDVTTFCADNLFPKI
jgi:hypothetical protein